MLVWVSEGSAREPQEVSQMMQKCEMAGLWRAVSGFDVTLTVAEKVSLMMDFLHDSVL